MWRRLWSWTIVFVLLGCWQTVMAQRNSEVRVDRWPGTVPVYTCRQVPDGAIRIDGKLDESCWGEKPCITFADLTYGTPPAHDGYAIVVWDQQYLYVGYHFVQPNLWAEVTSTRQNYASESRIMFTDQFCKIFLDPDGDGRDYLEWHINPAQVSADLKLTRPNNQTASFELGMPFYGYANTSDWSWSMPGLEYAVHLDGTLNNPADTDTGWEVEVAIPWAGLAPYTQYDCPPVYSKSWRMHLGRVEREQPGGARTYWTWPVMGIEQCHLPSRWGILYFVPADANVEPPASGDDGIRHGLHQRVPGPDTGGDDLRAGLLGAGIAMLMVGMAQWGRSLAKRGTKGNAGPSSGPAI